jgi:hypothetical protein
MALTPQHSNKQFFRYFLSVVCFEVPKKHSKWNQLLTKVISLLTHIGYTTPHKLYIPHLFKYFIIDVILLHSVEETNVTNNSTEDIILKL